MARFLWLSLCVAAAVGAASAHPGRERDTDRPFSLAWWLRSRVDEQESEIHRLGNRVGHLEDRLKGLMVEGRQKVNEHLEQWENNHLHEFHDQHEHGECHMSCEDSHGWGYGAGNGDHCWGECVPGCKGRSQSPINIEANAAVPHTFDNPTLSLHGYNAERTGSLSNNGHSVTVALDADSPSMTAEGIGLPAMYKAAQFHFHWGSTSARGSEHTINGRAYPMEMHIVHYNTNYQTLAEAADKHNGLAVLGFMFYVVPEDNPAFGDIVSHLSDVKHQGAKVDVAPFKMTDLIPDHLVDFYRYSGSLTTPPCYESVVWTLFSKPIGISEHQLKAFRHVHTGGHGHAEHALMDNFRSTQPVEGRAVWFSSITSIQLDS